MPDEPPGEPPPGRKKAYFWLMGTCLVLILLAWNVVRLWSVTAAVVMSVVAAIMRCHRVPYVLIPRSP